MQVDPPRRRELAQQGRLWLLALVCATVGAVVVWRTGSVYVGTGAFLVTLAVLGPVLWVYERRVRRAAGPEAGPSRRAR